MKLIAQKTIQNPNSQMMSLFDENDICLGEIHKREHSWHIVKCVNSHDALNASLSEIVEHLESIADAEGMNIKNYPIYQRAKQALKAAVEAV